MKSTKFEDMLGDAERAGVITPEDEIAAHEAVEEGESQFKKKGLKSRVYLNPGGGVPTATTKKGELMLVLFEGMPGSGKTTQMREVKHALEKLGHAVLVPNTKNKFIRQLERVIKQRKLSFVSPLRELILWKIKELQDANLRSV